MGSVTEPTTVTWSRSGDLPPQLLLDGVQAVLPAAEEHHAPGVVPRDLADELGADRPAGARDHHHAVREQLLGAFGVQVERPPPQQVLDLHLPHAREVHLAGEDLRHAGEDEAGEARLARDLHHAPGLAARGRGHGDQDLFDALIRAATAGEVIDRSEHVEPTDPEPTFSGVVVEEPHGRDAGLGVAAELAGHPRAGATRPHDERALVRSRSLRPPPARMTPREAAGGDVPLPFRSARARLR